MTGAAELRVIDFGVVSGLRSQTLWHAIAAGVSDGAPPTLSFTVPADRYVSIGYHSRYDAVDVAACAEMGVAVYRRMVGGGPVYLDPDQFFFQITVPVGTVPAVRTAALRKLLTPAVAAFWAAGVPARLDGDGEISVEDRKICGHAAGQIDRAVVVVGNLINGFDHEAAARVLAAPRPEARAELLTLMRRYVTATPADTARFRHAAIDAYADALGLTARRGALTDAEHAHLAEFDRRFVDPEWVRGDAPPPRPTWTAKVRAGVRVVAAEEGGTEVVAGIEHGRIGRIVIADPELDGDAAALERRLAGVALADAERVLEEYGPAGRRVTAVLAGAAGR